MPAVRIVDLAEVMVEQLAGKYGYSPESISIEEIGAKPGEKMYEELISHEEARRAVELENYYSVLPAFRGMYSDINYDYPGIKSSSVEMPYNSSNQPAMDKEWLFQFLNNNKLLETDKYLYGSSKRYWPGDQA